MPAASARRSAPASGLSEPTPATSISRPPASVPCSWSRIACRLVPAPEARTTMRNPLIAASFRSRRRGSDPGSAAAGDGRDLLERELAVRVLGVIAEGVAPREARVAVLIGRSADRLVDALDREVGQRVRIELVGDLLDA